MHIIPDDDDDDSLQLPDQVANKDPETEPPFVLQQQEQTQELQTKTLQDDLPQTITIDFMPLDMTSPNLIEEEEEPTTFIPFDELLQWHYKLSHISFKTLQRMANQGKLSCKLATVILPLAPPAGMANKQNDHGKLKVNSLTCTQ